MKRSVTIDGQLIELTPFDNNLVDVIHRTGIKIPAPCHKTKRVKGCCRVCVVDIDGQEAFACSTPPQHGMHIVVDRADLKALRKQRLQEYKESVSVEK